MRICRSRSAQRGRPRQRQRPKLRLNTKQRKHAVRRAAAITSARGRVSNEVATEGLLTGEAHQTQKDSNTSTVMKRRDALLLLGLDAKEGAPNKSSVRAAYHRLARVHHPDRAGGSAERFRAVHEAYKLLVAAPGEAEDAAAAAAAAAADSRWDGAEMPGAAHSDWTADDWELYVATWNDDTAKALRLLARGARPDGYQNDQWGGTCLMLAVQHGNVKLCAALLRHGASPFRRDSRRKTASQWAKRRHKIEVARLLRRWILGHCRAGAPPTGSKL